MSKGYCLGRIAKGHGRHLIYLFFFSIGFSSVFACTLSSQQFCLDSREHVFVCVLISNVSSVCCSCALYERARAMKPRFILVCFFPKTQTFLLLLLFRCSVLFALAYRYCCSYVEHLWAACSGGEDAGKRSLWFVETLDFVPLAKVAHSRSAWQLHLRIQSINRTTHSHSPFQCSFSPFIFFRSQNTSEKSWIWLTAS